VGVAPMKPTRPGSGSWQSTVSGTSPKLAGVMEVAIAGAAEVSRVSRRIFQKIWDPEPINDRTVNDPVWCLGCSYTLDTKTYGAPRLTASTPPADTTDTTETADTPQPPVPTTRTSPTPDTPPHSAASSFESSLAYEEPGQDGGWPPAFLDDFESRIWMTYRTGFEMIPRSEDPKASSALSFAMRLKTSFGEQTGGFSSDTGWGCMIRSGQSLLANALLITRLGRGGFAQLASPVCGNAANCFLVGDSEWRRGTEPGAEGEVLSLFADDPRAPYSLHNFVRHGAVACGKYPGEWFGPSATSRCIQYVSRGHRSQQWLTSLGH
jgi:cysteine protease ATG4